MSPTRNKPTKQPKNPTEQKLKPKHTQVIGTQYEMYFGLEYLSKMVYLFRYTDI